MYFGPQEYASNSSNFTLSLEPFLQPQPLKRPATAQRLRQRLRTATPNGVRSLNLGGPSVEFTQQRIDVINGLVEGKILTGNHGISHEFPWNMVFSCKFSLKPIHCLKLLIAINCPWMTTFIVENTRFKWDIHQMAVCQNLVPLVNIKIAGKWMFIPLKMVLIGIDPYPNRKAIFRDSTLRGEIGRGISGWYRPSQSNHRETWGNTEWNGNRPVLGQYLSTYPRCYNLLTEDVLECPEHKHNGWPKAG